jgi:nucleoid-associated protein YgaU
MRSGPPVGSAQNRPLGGREHLVVRPGDSLWALVARQLGADASARDIAHEWPRWYAANRSTIGADPDLIHPGQLLRAPDNRLPTHSQQEIP